MHRTIPHRFRILMPVGLIFVLTAGTFRTLHVQWVDWADTTHLHGYPVVAVCLWLLLRSAGAVPLSRWRPVLWGIPFLLATGVLWTFSAVAGIQLLELLLLPLLFGLAILVCAGSEVARRTAFAVAYLWFALPIWNVINPVLQWATIYASRFLLLLLGIPAYFSGNTVRIPAGTFEIAGGCSGIHFFVIALALAALLGELRGDTLKRRFNVIVLAGLIGMATNWIRVAALVIIGHVTHMQHPIIAESHYWFGWVVFACALVLFFFLESRVPANASNIREQFAAAVPSDKSWTGAVATTMLVAGLILWKGLATRPFESSWQPAEAPAGWVLLSGVSVDWRPTFLGIDSGLLDAWSDSRGKRVDRYSGLYRRQAQGAEFSGYGNLPRGTGPKEGWRFRETYTVDGREFGSPVPAQLWYAVRALTSLRAPPSRVQILRSACKPDCPTAESNLDAWKS